MKIKRFSRFLLDHLIKTRELGVFVPLLLIMIITGFINPVFWSSANMYNVSRDISFLLILSLGVTIVMLGGGIDISVAMVATLAGCVSGLMMVAFDFPVILAIICGLSSGLLCGFINGFIAAWMGVPSIITTLGMMFISMGVALVMSSGRPIFPFPEEYLFLGQGRLFEIPVPVLIS